MVGTSFVLIYTSTTHKKKRKEKKREFQICDTAHKLIKWSIPPELQNVLLEIFQNIVSSSNVNSILKVWVLTHLAIAK